MPPSKRKGWINWRNSAAKKVLLGDLETGRLSVNVDDKSAEEAWQHYKTNIAFANVAFAQFKERLKSHREQVKKHSAKGIDWDKSEASNIVMEDLRDGIFDNESPQDIWNVYKECPEFAKVTEAQFIDRLEYHRREIRIQGSRSNYQEVALLHDRHRYPEQHTDRAGKPVLYYHDAKLLLRQDVLDNLHTTLTPHALWSKRTEYQLFKQPYFARRVAQEVRRSKFVNLLEMKRERKQKERNALRGQYNRDEKMSVEVESSPTASKNSYIFYSPDKSSSAAGIDDMMET